MAKSSSRATKKSHAIKSSKKQERRPRRGPRPSVAQAGVGGAAAAQAKGKTFLVAGRLLAAGPRVIGDKTIDVLPDLPDIRDCMYAPMLRALKPVLTRRGLPFAARDQGVDGSCTGFALAHTIDLLQADNTEPDYPPQPVSARMLYEMAKRNDEWEGTAYQGSSLRGAIKGFFRNGVCNDALAPDRPGRDDWALTYVMAQEARGTRLGAYYRLRPDINDYHAALNEVSVIYVSAQIHGGWEKPADATIKPGGVSIGGHAFAVIGYDAKGFLVLNSWGPDWGGSGVAHWSYADWAATIMDAWVLQLAVRAPDAFGVVPTNAATTRQGLFGFGEPERADILGHFINIDDGRLQLTGKYASPTAAEMAETVKRLADPAANGGKGYQHLMIYAHGGLNSAADEATRIFAWGKNQVFTRNGIYNLHLMWDTALLEEVFGAMSRDERAGHRVGSALQEINDAFIEVTAKLPGSRAWRNMKQDARMAFQKDGSYGGGLQGLRPLFEGLAAEAPKVKVHLVGHSAGSILLGYLLSALSLKHLKLGGLTLGTVQLMAPACTVAFFEEHYRPYLKNAGAGSIDKMILYNLTDAREKDDTTGVSALPWPRYYKSLLYLVSRAFEEPTDSSQLRRSWDGTPLAGMEIYDGSIGAPAKLDIRHAGRDPTTDSHEHGGFDNDVKTLTSIMHAMLGAPPPAPPTLAEVSCY